MRSTKILLVLLTVYFLSGCSGDYRPKASGSFGSAVVIMDSTQWDSQTANAIRETYARGIFTLPGYEPMMDLRFRDFKNNNELETLRKNKNIIIASPINDSTNTAEFIRALLSDDVEQQVENGNSFAFPLQNQWYKDQWSVILTSTSDAELANKIKNSKNTLADQLLQVELNRWKYDIYEKGEQMDIEDSLWANHGWKMGIQHDWIKRIDTTYTENGKTNHLVTMRRFLSDNDRWFSAWWVNDAPPADSLNAKWINNKRDMINEKWFRGTRDSSYIITDYIHHSVDTDSLSIDAHQAFETQGVWMMTNDAMAGPFVNMTIYDEQHNRLFMLEFGQFAPTYGKRRFVRQFRAMLRTFKSDSTWNSSQ